ncbi:MAG: SEL1-like repeat protein [Motiliproteus sp.]|nr:SEL1-like repeat protein [Motiliproteus sp.]MCW9053586.1 SEL1-like repeat protein [Motiliproteus sp.]
MKLLRNALLFSMVLWAAVAQGSPLSQLSERLRSGVPVDDGLTQQLLDSADGMFALGWLYEHGSYGFPVRGETAYDYYQRAAEMGQMDAAHYCWWRCLHFTPALIKALRLSAEKGDPQGLYLHAMWQARQSGTALATADQNLVAAAKQKHPEAISELYMQHFLQWSGVKRSFDEAQEKLTRCADEGVVVCYLLLGALHQRHGNAEEALLNYLILQQLDYGTFRQYLSFSRLASLEQRLPSASLAVLHSRVATRLANHSATGFDVLDRFKVCASDATYSCVRALVKRDQVCMLGYFSDAEFAGFRQSAAYRDCMDFSAIE